MSHNTLYQTGAYSTNYEQRVSNHPESAVGGLSSGASKRSILINEIKNLDVNNGPTQPSNGPKSPSIKLQTPTAKQYTIEDLQEMSLRQLQNLYDELTSRLPLSQRFSKKDRQLASKSEEYKRALLNYKRGGKQKEEINPVDLS